MALAKPIYPAPASRGKAMIGRPGWRDFNSAMMRAALLEISPRQARDAGGGAGAQQMPVEEGPCYAGPRTGQVPWWLARHDRLVELPATRRCAVK